MNSLISGARAVAVARIRVRTSVYVILFNAMALRFRLRRRVRVGIRIRPKVGARFKVLRDRVGVEVQVGVNEGSGFVLGQGRVI